MKKASKVCKTCRAICHGTLCRKCKTNEVNLQQDTIKHDILVGEMDVENIARKHKIKISRVYQLHHKMKKKAEEQNAETKSQTETKSLSVGSSQTDNDG